MSLEINVVPAGTAKRARQGRYDYRKGVEYATSAPRGCQPRKGGPPLLFATDARMTILVPLALAGGPVRQIQLWRHIGRSMKLALYPLVKHGLGTSWKVGNASFIALDPCHPAAFELRGLLLLVAETFGFQPVSHDVTSAKTSVPMRASRRRDVRNTFGNRIRTMTLLLVHILGEASSTSVARCVPYLERSAVLDTLRMYEAFRLLKCRHVVEHKSRASHYSLNYEHPLAPAVAAVLGALDHATPQWRAAAERQRNALLPKRWDRKDGRRKRNRWKW